MNKIRIAVIYGDSRDHTLDLIFDFQSLMDSIGCTVELYQEPLFRNERGISSHWIADLCNGMRHLVKDEDYVIFMDDDVTYFSPEFIHRMVEADKDVVAPYVYLDHEQKEFWDTWVFRTLDGDHFNRIDTQYKDMTEPVEVGSVGTCICYKADVFKRIAFENPSPHLLWCANAREMGHTIWATPYEFIVHADVREERFEWNKVYGGKRMPPRYRDGTTKTSRKLMLMRYTCTFCGSTDVTLKHEAEFVYCNACTNYYRKNFLQKKYIEMLTVETRMGDVPTEPISKDSFINLLPSSIHNQISILAYVGQGYGGLASVPGYLKEGFDALGRECNIVPLDFIDYNPSDIEEIITKAYDDILYIHYDYLGHITQALLLEAEKQQKRVIVFPSDSWMDARPYVRKDIYEHAYKIIAYADWIKEYGWAGECRSYGVDPEKIEVIRFGVKKGRELSEKEYNDIREEIGLTTEYLIGEIGFVRPGKGFIKPMMDVLEQLPNVTFLITGSSDTSPYSKEEYFIKTLGDEISVRNLHDRVKWINRKLSEEELDRYLGACDMLVVPTNSMRDTSGAFNFSLGRNGGKCVITSTQRTRREVEEKYGACITSEIEDFPSTIACVLKDKVYHAYNKRARKYVEENSWTVFASKIYDMFRQAIIIPEVHTEHYPKVMMITAIKFDTEWQKEKFTHNIEVVKQLTYPHDKIKIVYLCASDNEEKFIKDSFRGTDFKIKCLHDPPGHFESLGEYRKFSVHFYGPLFNNARKEITKDTEYIFLVDADYVELPTDIIQQLISYNVDIISPYMYLEGHDAFFDNYGFATHGFPEYNSKFYTQFLYQDFPYRDVEGIFPLAYAGTGVQMIRKDVFLEFPWVNPDSWLHWCQQAREKGYIVWGVPTLKVYHGAGYAEAEKESRTFYDLVYTDVIDVDKCISMGLFTEQDWFRYLFIKKSIILPERYNNIWNKTIGKWVQEGRCTLFGLEGLQEMICN
jgi:glycosyltransferase involved in cell wall biosynthesis/GT2 family glycosyltransferase